MTLIFPLLIALSAAPVPDDATEMARMHFTEGVTQYKLARFDTALTSFESAYEAKPLPGFLFNIAQCHFQLGHYDKAIFFYEGYLHGRPDAPNRQAVSERMEEAKRMLASREAAHQPAPAADDPAQRDEALDAVRRAEDVARRLEKKLEAADERPPAETSSGPPYLLWGAVGATGAAAAAATAAAVVGGGLVLFVVATQPDLMQPSGSLGTLDRSPHTP